MRKKGLALLTVSCLCVSAFAGCNKKEKANDTTTTPEASQDAEASQTPAEDTFTVTFYDSDGTTVLKTEDVKSGDCATEYTPEKGTSIFMGWYATPSLSHDFDFTQPITEDKSVFAGFVEDVADTRKYAIVGSGTSPILIDSDWGKNIADKHYMEKAADSNTYTLTCDLYEGDEFQFAISSAWEDKRGVPNVENTEGLDQYIYAKASDGMGGSNIKCVKSGNYTITLVTYPSEDQYETDNPNYTEDQKEVYNYNNYDKITFVYNGDVKEEKVDATTSYYIKGAKITEWADKVEDTYMFKDVDGIPTLTIDLEKDDEFMFYSMVTVGDNTSTGTEYVRFTNIQDDDSKAFVDGTDSANLIAKESGTYTFTYDPATTVLTVNFKTK